MNGNDVINDALLADGVIYPGQTISTEASTACQLQLNNMLSEWNAQGLAVFSVVKTTTALSSGTADYTLATRAEKIEAWSVIDTSGAAHGGEPVDPKTFARLADDRSLTAARVEMLNYDANYPNAMVHLYPAPTGGTLELWVWEQLAAITDFTAALAFPPGYLKAIVYNLAVDLAPKFGREVSQTVKLIADGCRATLGATNISEQTRVPPERKTPTRAA